MEGFGLMSENDDSNVQVHELVSGRKARSLIVDGLH